MEQCNEYQKIGCNRGIPYEMIKECLPNITYEVNEVIEKIIDFRVKLVGKDETSTKNQKVNKKEQNL